MGWHKIEKITSNNDDDDVKEGKGTKGVWGLWAYEYKRKLTSQKINFTSLTFLKASSNLQHRFNIKSNKSIRRKMKIF